MKLDLVADLDVESISKIWVQKHMDQEDTISAVVPAETYKKMLSRSKEYPLVCNVVCQEQNLRFGRTLRSHYHYHLR